MFIKINKVAGKRIIKGGLRTESKNPTEYDEIIKEEVINSRYIKRIWPKERYPDYSYITTKDMEITVKNNFYDLCRKLNVK